MSTNSIDIDYDRYIQLVWRVAELDSDETTPDDVDFTVMFEQVLANYGGHLARVIAIGGPDRQMYAKIEFDCAQQLTLWTLKYM